MGAIGERSPLERTIRIALLALAVLLFLIPAAAAAQAKRIVAVGDLHGDYQAWLTIARSQPLSDERPRKCPIWPPARPVP